MKKIKNNVRWGQITMLLNLLLAVLIIVAVILLMKFDKVNVQLQNAKPGYDNVQDSIKRTQQNIHDYNKKVENSNKTIAMLLQKNDSLSTVVKTLGKDAEKEKAILTDEVKYNEDQIVSLKEKIKTDEVSLMMTKDTLEMFENEAKPVIAHYNEIGQQVTTPLHNYNLIIIIIIILFFVKILMFAFWNYLNMNNLQAIAPWMKKSTKPWWAIVGWFIPIYNLIKPCSVFSEMWDETTYLLKEKAIVANENDNNQIESIGLWWGLYIFGKCLMPFVIGGLMICINFWWLLPLTFSPEIFDMGVFFGAKGFFLQFNHVFVAIIVVLAFVLYFIYEAYLICKYNKMNVILCNNQAKFDTNNVK